MLKEVDLDYLYESEKEDYVNCQICGNRFLIDDVDIINEKWVCKICEDILL